MNERVVDKPVDQALQVQHYKKGSGDKGKSLKLHPKDKRGKGNKHWQGDKELSKDGSEHCDLPESSKLRKKKNK